MQGAHARYVGRVGGLAVALGVGFAVASGAAVAHATEDNASADTSVRSSHAGDQAAPRLAGGKNSRSLSRDTRTDAPRTSEAEPSTSDAGPVTRPGTASRSETDSETASSDDGEVDAPHDSRDTRLEDFDSDPATDEVEPPNGGTAIDDTSTPRTRPTPLLGRVGASRANGQTRELQEELGTPANASNSKSSARASIFHSAGSGVPAAAPLRAGATTTPPANAPIDNPLATTFLAFWRHVTGMMYNRNPSAVPIEIGENAQGFVLGSVGGTDPDGDRLLYTLTQAARYGDVTLNADGTYIYRPGYGINLNGGTDTFTVEVRDVGFRLLSRPGVVSVPVTVTLGAGDVLGIGGRPFAVVTSTDGKTLYVSDVKNNRVSVIDVTLGAVTQSIAVGKSPYGMAMAADGRLFVVNSDDGTVSMIDTRTNSVVGAPIRVGNSPTSVAVNQSGTTIYVTNSNDDSVSVIDTATLSAKRILVGDGAFGVAIGGGKVYVTNELDNTVSVINIATNSVVKTLAAGVAPTSIAVRGDRAVVTNSGSWANGDDGSVTIIDTTTDTVLTTIGLGESPAGVAIDADAGRAYITDVGGRTVTIVDLRTGLATGDPVDVVDGAAGVAITADGRLWVAGSRDGVVAPVALSNPVAGVFAPLSVLPVASSAVGAVAGVTAAASSPGRPHTNSKGFDVYNLTTSTLTLSQFASEARPEPGSPAEGYTIPPGGKLHFEIGVDYWAPVRQVSAVFTNSNKETWTVHMTAEWVIVAFVPIRVAGQMRVNYSGGNAGTADPDPNNWLARYTTETYLYDKSGTKKDFQGSPTKASTDLLNTVCESGRATCVFTPNNDVPVTAGWTPFKAPSTRGGSASISNNSPVQQTGQVKVVETDSSKFTLEGSLKFSFGAKDKLGVEIAGKIGNDWTTTKTFEETTTIVAPPYTKVDLVVRTPVLKVTGDLVVRIGNSVVTYKNVVIEVPDTDRAMEKYYNSTPLDKPTTIA